MKAFPEEVRKREKPFIVCDLENSKRRGNIRHLVVGYYKDTYDAGKQQPAVYCKRK